MRPHHLHQWTNAVTIEPPRHLALSGCIVLAIAISVCPVTIAQDGTDNTNDVTPDDVASILRASNVLNADRNFATTLLIEKHTERTEGQPGTWDETPITLREEIRHVFCDRMFYLRHRNLAASGDEAGYERICVWRNGTWDQRVTTEQHLVTLSDAATPGDLFNQAFIVNLVEGRIPSWDTLAQLAESGDRINSSRTDDTLTYRFAKEGVPDQRVQYEVQLHVASTPRLESFSIELFDDAAEMITRQSYTVDNWQQYGDALLPSHMTIDGWTRNSPNPSIPPPLVSRVEYKRLNFETLTSPCSEMTDLFDTPFPAGTSVHDDRLNLSYEIGQSYLYLDGVRYRLDEALTEPPGDDLDVLLASPTAESAPAPTDTNQTQTAASSAQGLTTTGMLILAVAALLVVAGVCVVARAVFTSNSGKAA